MKTHLVKNDFVIQLGGTHCLCLCPLLFCSPGIPGYRNFILVSKNSLKDALMDSGFLLRDPVGQESDFLFIFLL